MYRLKRKHEKLTKQLPQLEFETAEEAFMVGYENRYFYDVDIIKTEDGNEETFLTFRNEKCDYINKERLKNEKNGKIIERIIKECM